MIQADERGLFYINLGSSLILILNSFVTTAEKNQPSSECFFPGRDKCTYFLTPSCLGGNGGPRPVGVSQCSSLTTQTAAA